LLRHRIFRVLARVAALDRHFREISVRHIEDPGAGPIGGTATIFRPDLRPTVGIK